MDGEAASENYAGLRYRDADFAKLMTNYVPLVASPNRHTPRDYDANGKRVICPRFGRVTCTEHINIEPVLYAKYFKGSGWRRATSASVSMARFFSIAS